MTETTIDNRDYEPLTIEAQTADLGDMLQGKFRIAGVDVKAKWTYVRVDGEDKPRKYPNDEAILVFRETDESREARHAARKRESLNERITEWLDNFQPRRRTYRIQGEINQTLGQGYVDYDLMGRFIEAQAYDRVDGTIAYNLDNWRKGEAAGVLGAAADLYAAAEILAQSSAQQAMTMSPLSRSTSLMSNVIQDVERSAHAAFAQEWNRRWFA